MGTAYVALFNYALARQNAGQFVLRIEDTDRERSHPASEAMIFEALHWLGLAWDEGPDKGGPHAPYRQSERSAIYREHAAELVKRGIVFAGLDVIGDWLTEINVTSPTGIRELDAQFGLDIAGMLFDAIERRLANPAA